MSAPLAAPSDQDLGALLSARRFSPTGYYLGSGFIFLAPLVLGLILVVGSPSKSVGDNAFALGVLLFFGTVGALPLFIKAYRKSGLVIEAYERGMRFVRRSGEAATFSYADVTELRRKVFNGALASLTLVLADGRSYVVDVQGKSDLALVQEVLSRFGDMQWEADRGFRLM